MPLWRGASPACSIRGSEAPVLTSKQPSLDPPSDGQDVVENFPANDLEEHAAPKGISLPWQKHVHHDVIWTGADDMYVVIAEGWTSEPMPDEWRVPSSIMSPTLDREPRVGAGSLLWKHEKRPGSVVPPTPAAYIQRCAPESKMRRPGETALDGQATIQTVSQRSVC